MIFKIGNRELNFDENTKNITFEDKTFSPSIRTFGDMKAMYKTNEEIDNNLGLYFMYRDVHFLSEDKDCLSKDQMRYDVTILVPKSFSGENNKTYGHYHPKKVNSDKRFTEIYEVLYGEAIYLQQNENEVFYTKALAGDKIVMEEGYGHITINSGIDYLVMANLVDDTFSSDYGDYKNNNGGAYYYKDSKFIQNKLYNELPIKESYDKFDGINIYDDFLKDSEKFSFLH